tara:strand:- start:12390 stop:12707 length:318 start_codon:yes stop_codon:yes gene_type:complete
MEIDNNNVDRKYLRAKKRVDELKKYYRHLSIYIVVNTIISVSKIVNEFRDGDSFEEVLFDFDNFSLWVWWGIGIAFHTYKVFGGRLLFLNKDWEDKKIKEYMNEK